MSKFTLYEKAITVLLTVIVGMLGIAVNVVLGIADNVEQLLISRENHEVRITYLENHLPQPRPREPEYTVPRAAIKPNQKLGPKEGR